MTLAWAASPRLLIRYSLLGMFNAIMPPISVYLGAVLVNKIAEAHLHPMKFEDVLYIVIGLWITFVVQRAVGAYMGFGRNLYVRRVELEAERRLLEKASKVDLGHFDNSDWHDRLARAKRDVNWRPGDLTWSILGLSGNIVSIILMAGLLASLHYILVVLALGQLFFHWHWRAAPLQNSINIFIKKRLKKESGNISAICWCNHATQKK